MRFAKGTVVLGLAVACFVVVASTQPAWAQDDDAACAAAEKAGKALVNFVSDAKCKLTVNGQALGELAANQERAIAIPDNEQKIQCASTEIPGAVAQIEDRLTGCGSSVSLEVADMWRRFTAGKNGMVVDSAGVTWLQSDNGANIDWEGAKKFCAGKGGRLPTDSELRQLHTEGKVTTPCGEYPCNMSHLFKLTNRFFWSSVPFEKDQAIVVGLAGFRPAVQSVKTNVSQDARALCVAGTK
jgi:hypothetical protein